MNMNIGIGNVSVNGSNSGGNVNDVPIGNVNGYGNINNNSNDSSADNRNSSSVSSSTLDLNDFPSLGGGGGVPSTSSSSGANGGGINNNNSSNGLEAALRQNQLLLAHQQMMQQNAASGKSSNLYRLAMSSSGGGGNAANAGAAGNFNMTTEDFPALPGALPPAAGVSNLLGGSGLLDTVSHQQRENGAGGLQPSSSSVNSAGNQGNTNQLGGGNGMYNIDLENSSSGASSLGAQQGGTKGRESSVLGASGVLGSLGVMQSNNSTSTSQQSNNPHQQRSGNPTSSSTTSGPSSSTAGSALSGDYGLLGLLGVIRMSDADRNALALGSDLTTLGLNLNSQDQLYSTFASPWSDSPATREPQYQLPMCYYMQPPALKTGHLSKFHLETLFYIFYALPKDVLQAYAAQELYARDWRYHVELKLWFKRAGPADGVPSSNNGIQYIYFDINSWERRLFTGNMHQNITSGLLSEEDVRVKFPNS